MPRQIKTCKPFLFKKLSSLRAALSVDEARVYDFINDLSANKGASDARYRECVDQFGEAALIQLTSLVGHFVLVSMVLNVAGTPADATEGVEAFCRCRDGALAPRFAEASSAR